MNSYLIGFEEDDHLRSSFIRELTLQQLEHPSSLSSDKQALSPLIPKKLIRYWHDQHNVPEDVMVCLRSWDRLLDDGFECSMFNDESAMAYIAERFGAKERKAFSLCYHPAMRCDYRKHPVKDVG